MGKEGWRQGGALAWSELTSGLARLPSTVYSSCSAALVRASTEGKEGSVQNQKPQRFYSRCGHPQDWASSYHLPATGRCLSVLSVASHDSENCLSLSAAHPAVHEVGVAPAGQHVHTCTQTPSSWGAATPPNRIPPVLEGWAEDRPLPFASVYLPERKSPELFLAFQPIHRPRATVLGGTGQVCPLITKKPHSDTWPPV